jgi:hypothetical protein
VSPRLSGRDAKMPLPASYCRQLETPCGPHRAVFICRSFAYTVHLFLSAPYTGGISSPFLVCFAGYSICIFTLTSVRHPARPSCGALLREPLSYSPWVVARSRESHYQTRSRPLCAPLLPSSFGRQIRIRWQASLRFALIFLQLRAFCAGCPCRTLGLVVRH